MTSGEYLKSLRESKNLTQSQLAIEFKTSHDYIGRLERNGAKPSTKFIIYYSYFFNVPLEQVFLSTLRPFWTELLEQTGRIMA